MNKIKTLLCATLLALTSISAMAKDYQAVAFGVKSDGVTNNTRSIQHAIDYISAQGGGRLVFYVGRYLTGSIELKSGVTLVIHEGAVLVASPSVYDHKGSPRRALIHAQGQHDIAIMARASSTATAARSSPTLPSRPLADTPTPMPRCLPSSPSTAAKACRQAASPCRTMPAHHCSLTTATTSRSQP